MRTFCLKRRTKGGIAEKGGKRRNLTPWDLLPALLSINHNQPSLEIIIVNSFEDLHL